jgi:hypothetical protein
MEIHLIVFISFFYDEGQNPYKLQLYQPCNYSAIWAFSNAGTANDSLYCDRFCNRVQCKPAYRPAESTCGKIVSFYFMKKKIDFLFFSSISIE